MHLSHAARLAHAAAQGTPSAEAGEAAPGKGGKGPWACLSEKGLENRSAWAPSLHLAFWESPLPPPVAHLACTSEASEGV